MLEDAEILLGVARHLATLQRGRLTAELDNLAFAGRVFELAFALRGSRVSSIARVQAIAVEAGIGGPELAKLYLPTLEALGWVSLDRDSDQVIVRVTEVIPSDDTMLRSTPTVLKQSLVTPTEVASLQVLRSSTQLPLHVNRAIQDVIGTGQGTEEHASNAIRILTKIGLIRTAVAADGDNVVFNPNVWVDQDVAVEAALRSADSKIYREVAALMEEVSSKQGIPEDHVKSTEQRWVDFAVAMGLIQRTMIQTKDGQEKRFLFTPHLHRDAFTKRVRDPSGHARQLAGSMIYAATFAETKLYSPVAFVRALIRDGEAGNARPIGSDYPMLETAGIVRVVPGTSSGLYRFQLLQPDVAEEALTILRDTGAGGGQSGSASSLSSQRRYGHVERERALIAQDVPDGLPERQKLIAALREQARRRD